MKYPISSLVITSKYQFLQIIGTVLPVVFLFSELNDNRLASLLVFIGTFILVFSPQHLIPLFLISSLGNSFFAHDGVSLSRIFGFILIFSVSIRIIKNKYLVSSRLYLSLFLALFYALFSSLLSITGSLVSFLTFSQNLIVFTCLINLSKVDVVKLTQSLVISSLVSVLLLAVSFKDAILNLGIQRLALEDQSINRLATMIAQLVAMSFAGLWFVRRNYLLWLTILLIVLLGMGLILLTGTRSALFAVLLSSIIVALAKYRFRMKHVMIFMVSVALVLVLPSLDIDVFDYHVLDRFSMDAVKRDGGSGRAEIWRTLIPITYRDSLLFGFGFGSENVYKLASFNGFKFSAHNILIDMFIQNGLIGMGLFLTIIIGISLKVVKRLRDKLFILPFMIIFTGLFNGIGETIFLEKFFWNALGLSVLFIKNTKLKKILS